jgi:AcrR family transcriptional regulator
VQPAAQPRPDLRRREERRGAHALRLCFFGSVTDVVDRFFPDPSRHKVIRTMLAFLPVNSTHRGPYTPGSATCLVSPWPRPRTAGCASSAPRVGVGETVQGGLHPPRRRPATHADRGGTSAVRHGDRPDSTRPRTAEVRTAIDVRVNSRIRWLPMVRPRSPARLRARRLSSASRRAQLLDTAARLLAEAGTEALTMERLAARAGVSKGLGYAYFRDAEDVMLSLWDREVSDVYARVEAALDETTPFDQGLRSAVAAYFDVVAERGALLGVLQARFGSAGSGRRRIARRVRAFLEFWAERIRRTAGVEPTTALALAGIMVNAADAAARAWSARVVSREEAERLCVGFLVQGLPGALSEAGPPARRERGTPTRRTGRSPT